MHGGAGQEKEGWGSCGAPGVGWCCGAGVVVMVTW